MKIQNNGIKRFVMWSLFVIFNLTFVIFLPGCAEKPQVFQVEDMKIEVATNPSTPKVGDVLTGWTDLPGTGSIAANDGEKVYVAEVKTATNKVVKFGSATAVVTPKKNYETLLHKL